MEAAELRMRFTSTGAPAVKSDIRSVDSEIDRMGHSADAAKGRLGGMFSIAGGIIGAQIVGNIAGWAGGILMMSANAEQARMSLETVTGSAARADELFRNIQEFARATPFSFPELVQSTINLEAFGLKSAEWLPVIGDTASAMGKSVDQVTQAVLDASSGQYERLKELGIMAAVEGDKLKLSYMQNGQMITETVDRNNKEIVGSTIASIWSEKYEGAMEKQSKSFLGQYSTLKDNIAMKLQEASGSVFSFATNAIGFFNDIFANGFLATVRGTFGDGVADFIGQVAGMASALRDAWGSGERVNDLLQRFPAPLQSVGHFLLLAADAAGYLYRTLRDDGLAGALLVLPDLLGQVWDGLRPLINEGFRALGDAVKAIPWGTIGDGIGRLYDEIKTTLDTFDYNSLGETIGSGLRSALVAVVPSMFSAFQSALEEHWQTILKWFLLWPVMLPAAIGKLQQILVPKAVEFLEGFLTGLGLDWDGTVKPWLAGLAGQALLAVGELGATLEQKGRDLINGWRAGARAAWNLATLWLSTRADSAVNAIGSLLDTLFQAGDDLILGFYRGATQKWDTVTGWIVMLADDILSWASDLNTGLLYQVGIDVVQGFADGLYAGAGAVSSAVSYLVGLVPGPIRSMLGISSPSQVMRNMMLAVPQGIALGMLDGVRDVEHASLALARAASGGGTATSRVALSSRSIAGSSGGSGSGAGVAYYDMRGSIIGADVQRWIDERIASGQGRRVDRSVGRSRIAESFA